MTNFARWERRVQLGAHPVLYPVIRGLGYFRPVLRIPGLGVLVSEAGLVRHVLTDQEGYVKAGPSASGGLWTPVVGPKVLLNMDGTQHLELRRRLNGLFTPRSVAGIVGPAAERFHDQFRRGLRSGRARDVVGAAKDLSGGVISRLLGIPDDGPGRRPTREFFNPASSIRSLGRLGRPKP